MNDTLKSVGVPTAEQVASRIPPLPRRKLGPYVTIECFQPIPCDPCYHSCRFGAIAPFDDINDIPEVDWSRCTGCGLCVAACPGLAIFVVDETFGDDLCLIAVPYELAPLPKKGDPVVLLDRAGVAVGEGSVERVIPGRRPAGTPVVWLQAPKDLASVVRGFRKAPEKDGGGDA